MTASEEKLWSTLEGNSPDRLQVAKSMIEQDKTLVDSINKEGFSLLLYVLSKKDTWVLLDVIATHANRTTFTYALPDSPGNTPIHAILSTYDPTILGKFIKHSIVFNGSELSYVEANENVTTVQKRHQREFAKNPNSPATQRASTQLENTKLIRTMLRDATSREAVRIWDVAVPLVTPKMLEDINLRGIDLSEVGNEEEQGFIWSFIKARLYIAKLELDYKTKNAINPNSVETKTVLSQLENAKLMRTLFRDKVIEEAVERNKSSILNGLEAAGDKVGYLTQNDETYYSLATKDERNPKTDILEWHKERSDASAAKYSKARDAFQNAERAKRAAEEKLAECTREYHGKINAALAGSDDHTTAVTRIAFGVG